MDIWTRVDGDNKEDIGELIIKGNSISFILKDCSFDMGSTFINKKDFNRYIVKTDGIKSSDGTGYFLDVLNVFEYGGYYNEFEQEVNSVKSISFEFPELANWLKIQSVDYGWAEEGELVAFEVKKDQIVLKEGSSSITIQYEIESPYARDNSKTEFLLKNSPKVIVSYTNGVPYETAFGDIGILMRFFGLMIGRVSNVDNIILKTTNKMIRAFINFDFSHNVQEKLYGFNYRIAYDDIKEKIQDYVENWYKRIEDERYNFIFSAFFSCKTRRLTVLEDFFLTYCRFLEGYDQIRNGEIEVSKEIEGKICTILKEDKAVIALFKSILKEFSSSKLDNTKVAQYISRAFMERKGLQDRIEKLDKDFFNLIANNSGRNRLNIFEYKTLVGKIVKTRNYYSHFNSKAEEKLNFSQMVDVIEVFEAMVVSILLYEIGMGKDFIKHNLRRDDKYHFIFQPKAEEMGD